MKHLDNKGMAKNAVVAIVFVIAILVIAALAFGWVKFTPGCVTRDKAIEKYFQAVSDEDAKLYKNTCYTKKWQSNHGSQSLDDSVKEVFSLQSGAKYGDVDFTAFEKLDKSYATQMTNVVRQVYGIDVKVSRISKVNFSVQTTFGGEKSKSGTLTRYCYKSGGKWYYLADSEVLIQLGLE